MVTLSAGGWVVDVTLLLRSSRTTPIIVWRRDDTAVVPSIAISVQAEPRDADSWLALARRLQTGGFDALLVGDHPGSGAAPWPALGAAAAVTTRLRLGTYVL